MYMTHDFLGHQGQWTLHHPNNNQILYLIQFQRIEKECILQFMCVLRMQILFWTINIDIYKVKDDS